VPARATALALAAALALAGCGTAQERRLTPPPADVIAADAGDVVDAGEIVALVATEAAADRLATAAAGAGYRLAARDSLGALGEVMLTFRIPPGTGPAQAIAALEALEPGATAGVNHAYRPQPDGATGVAARRYAGALIGWPEEGCRARVPVGILDADLDPAAGPLSEARVVRLAFVEASGAAGSAAGRSASGGPNASSHGTAVAEILAGPGRLRDARLYHAAVVGAVEGREPAAGVDAILRALDWLGSEDVRLVNVSLAGPYNKILDRGLQAAAERGMVVIAAAGNVGAGGPPRYPAALPSSIAVTAVDAALAPYRGAPDGPHIDVAAPGVDVFVQSAAPGRYLSGTSLAAPFVTAAIAADPEAARLRSGPALRAWLAGRALDLGPPGPDSRFGAGLIQTGPGCR